MLFSWLILMYNLLMLLIFRLLLLMVFDIPMIVEFILMLIIYLLVFFQTFYGLLGLFIRIFLLVI
jgi:hypothetical protein